MPRTLSDDGNRSTCWWRTGAALFGIRDSSPPLGYAQLKRIDESGPDAEVLAVPIDKLCTLYRHARSPEGMPEMLLAQIAHFLQHSKDLEPDKRVKTMGLAHADAARAEIAAGVERFKAAKVKPFF